MNEENCRESRNNPLKRNFPIQKLTCSLNGHKISRIRESERGKIVNFGLRLPGKLDPTSIFLFSQWIFIVPSISITNNVAIICFQFTIITEQLLFCNMIWNILEHNTDTISTTNGTFFFMLNIQQFQVGNKNVSTFISFSLCAFD